MAVKTVSREESCVGNGVTLKELEEIEEKAHRSDTDEARTILRLCAALREAMQVRENALALINLSRARDGKSRRGESSMAANILVSGGLLK
jgi:hypothetical protein